MKDKKQDLIQDKYKIIFESIDDAVYVHTFGNKNIRGKFLDVNKAAIKMLGYSKEEFLNLDPSKIDDVETAKKVLPDIAEKLKKTGKAKFEMLHIKKNGQKIPVEINSNFSIFDGQEVIVSIVRDISENKKIKEELEENIKRFEDVSKESEKVFWEIDKNGLYTYVSDLSKKIYGYSKDELVAKKYFYDLFADVANENVGNFLKKMMKDPIKIKNFENKILTKDKKIKTLITNGAPIIKNNKILGYKGVDIDITDKLMIEDRYKKLFNNIPSGIAIYEVKDSADKFYFKDINSFSEKLDNLKKEKIISKEIREVFPKVEEMGLVDVFKKVYKTGKLYQDIESEYFDSKKNLRFFRDNFVFKISENEIVSVYNDVSDRVYRREELEKKMQELEKFNSIMSGRELKMIELKKEIEELKNKKN